MTKINKININSLIKIQNKVKYKLKFIKNINNELQFIYNIIKNITIRIRSSLVVNIISQTKFNQNMNDIENTFIKFNNIYKHKITCRYLTSITHYNLLLNISKIKLELIKIMKSTGSNTIEDIIKLILNKEEQKLIFNQYKEIYYIYNTYFNNKFYLIY